MKRLSALFVMIVAAGVLMGPRWTEDSLQFGDGTDTDKDIVIDNGDANSPLVRYDAGTSRWQMSNDGTTFNNMPTTSELSAKLENVVEDTTPELGYNLDIAGFKIVDGAQEMLFKVTALNSYYGGGAGVSTQTGNNNTGFGTNGLAALTDGFNNTSFGSLAGDAISTGDRNTAVGASAASAVSTAERVTAVGGSAFAAGTGSRNTAIGQSALSGAVTGISNTAVGQEAGTTVTSGTNNTLLGQAANVSVGTVGNSVALGSGATVDASNKIRLGNASVTVVEIPSGASIQTDSGAVDVTGGLTTDQIQVDGLLQVDGTTISGISGTSDIVIDPSGAGRVVTGATLVPNGSFDLGASANQFGYLHVSNGVYYYGVTSGNTRIRGFNGAITDYQIFLPQAQGASNQILVNDGAGNLSWQNQASGFADPMTTRGDMIYRDATNTTARLPVGAANSLLVSDGTDVAWQDADTTCTSNVICEGQVGAGTETAGTNADACVVTELAFIKVGSQVKYSFLVSLDATAANTSVECDLVPPIASNFADAADAWGMCEYRGTTASTETGGNIVADATDDELYIRVPDPQTTAATNYICQGGYYIQ